MGYGGYSGYGRDGTGVTGYMTDLPLDAVSLSELAKERGVSGAAIRKRVLKLEAAGLVKGYIGPGGAKYISRAAFDFAVTETGDPVKEASAASAAVIRNAPEQPQPRPVTSDQPMVDGETPGYRDAKARDAYYAAELKRLQFEREDKRIYYVEEVDAALVKISGALRDATKSLVTQAEAGAEALEKGMPAFRRWLSDLGDDICRQLAASWRVMAEDTSGQDKSETPPEEEETEAQR